jgi:hypothetical protein
MAMVVNCCKGNSRSRSNSLYYRGMTVQCSCYRGSIVVSVGWSSSNSSWGSCCIWSIVVSKSRGRKSSWCSSIGISWSSMSQSNGSHWMSNSLTYRIHITILVKILRESFQSNGCQSSGCLYQVTISRGEGTQLGTLVYKTSVGEGDSSSHKTRQDKLEIIMIITKTNAKKKLPLRT